MARSLQEQLDRMKKLSKVPLKEASYKAVLSDEFNGEHDDNLSRSMYAGGPEPQSATNSNIFDSVNEAEPELPSGITSPAPASTGDTGMPAASTEPAIDSPAADDADMMDSGIPAGDEMLNADPAGTTPPAPSHEETQNELLAIQVAALQKLNDKIGDLDNMFGMLTAKYNQLNKEVEEVKEPTDGEKLQSRKKDSHPYYFNLSDMWQDNYFQSRQDQFGGGMVKLDDGSYVADFDQLPKLGDKDIKDSFNNF